MRNGEVVRAMPLQGTACTAALAAVGVSALEDPTCLIVGDKVLGAAPADTGEDDPTLLAG